MANLVQYAVIDIQGVYVPEFFPKEITILHNDKTVQHYILRTPTRWRWLTDDAKNMNVYVEQQIHGIKYSFTDENTLDYYHLVPILKNLQEDVVYVKGHQKKKFLEQFLGGKSVINLETYTDCPKLGMPMKIECPYHSSIFRCSFNIVYVIDEFIKSKILHM